MTEEINLKQRQLNPSLVSDVAGVVCPHQLTETLMPPSGQMQSHMEGVLNLRNCVASEEPIPWNLSHPLLRYNLVNKRNRNMAAQWFI